MNDAVLNLGKAAQLVFREVKERKAMPFLEIAGVTGIRGMELQNAVSELAQARFVTLSQPNNVFQSIVSISGRYF